jgi:CRISPR system Cascade subunit CasD
VKVRKHFGVVLGGDKNHLETIATALQNPVWGVWLGRKNCIPTSPVYVGTYESEMKALKSLVKGKSGKYRCQREVSDFGSGVDSISDQVVSFDSAARKFVPRRIKQEWIDL